MQTVKLADARAMMKSTVKTRLGEEPKPFDLTWITCDEQRNTGGEFRSVAGAVLASMAHQIPKAYKDSTGEKEPDGLPRHYFMIVLPNGEIKKVFWRLITEFNGKEVVW